MLLCTICLRKGSKGVKNKNLRDFHKGNSLFDLTLNQALSLKNISKIVISTDYNQLLKKKNLINNGKIILQKRNKNLCTDNIPKIEVIRDALIYAEKISEMSFDYILDLDVTTPLREIIDIKKSINIFLKNKSLNNLMTISESKKNPYYNMVKTKGLKISLISNKKEYFSRQVAPKIFDVNSSIYLWRKSKLLNKKLKIINNMTGYHIMPLERSIDIDNHFDLKLAKFLFHENKK